MFSPHLTLAQKLGRAARPSAIVKSLPAPIGGWNARDALPAMKPTDAVYLNNFIPDAQGVRQRRGIRTHATGLTGNFIESLMEYSSPGSNPKLFAATPDTIWDVTAAATASAVVTGLTNGRHQHTMFSTPGGDFLVTANGADSVRNYDGSSWSTPSISGVTSSTLVGVHSHMERLWFIQSATAKVWYLGSQSVSGTANSIDFAPILRNGGQLMAMGSWTRDGGSGMEDVAVFVFSGGEMLLYSGTDPSSANTWERIGHFDVPPPIGRRCLIKLGAELCYLSGSGLLPVPQFLNGASADISTLAKTDKISGAFRQAYQVDGDNFGWEVKEYPKDNLLIINVPVTERATQRQFVMNLQTNAWCRFQDLNAGCWATKGDDLFFGGNDGKVYQYGGSGIYDDDGTPVNALGISAFSDFGTPQQKSFKMARPLLHGPEQYSPQVRLLVDYDAITLPTFSPTAFEGVGPYWDEELWDTVLWATGLAVSNPWQTITGTGVVGALALASQVTTEFIWNQTDVVYETGGIL